MIEALPKVPNSPEHIEMRSHEIDDKGNVVLFTFRFSAAITPTTFDHYFLDPGSAVKNIVAGKLLEKGWMDAKEDFLYPLDYQPYPSKDKRTWVIRYELKGKSPLTL